MEEGFGEGLVRVVRRADTLVQVLGEEVQLQVVIDLAAGATTAQAVQQGFLGRIQGADHPAVLLRQLEPALFDVQLAHRFEQRGLVAEIQAQLAIQSRQALLHRLVGEQRVPAYRQQAIPGGAGHQQQWVAPELLQLAVALVGGDHAVDGEDQRGLGDRAVAFAERTEHDQGEGGQRQAGDEQPRIGKQQLDGDRGDAEAQQGHQQRAEPAQPAVVGLRQGAGDDAEE